VTAINTPKHIILPSSHVIDIWQIDLDRPTTDKRSLLLSLDKEETERYQKRQNKLQSSYLLSHAACRQILAHYLKLTATEITYKKNQHGKPLLDHKTPLNFNMSHSRDKAIVAVTSHSTIGVDIEFSDKNTGWQKIVPRYFHPDEINYLFAQPKDLQKQTFFQIWTRKEAFIKAIGTGFATALASFSVIDEKISDQAAPSSNSNNWYRQDLEINSPYIASVVQNTQIKKIRYYSY